MDILYNLHFEPFFFSQHRYAILYGGAGSGKSHVVAQKIVDRCTRNNERHKFLVVRKFRTTLEGSVYTLIKSVISDFGLMPYVHINHTKMSFTFHNGNEIIVTGLDDPEKVKSIHGITGIWCEEITELEEEDFSQLDLRLRGVTDSYKQICMSFNPISSDHWIHKMFFENEVDGCFKLWSNYKHNLFLDDQYITVLESRFEYDPNMKRIYVNGEWGKESTKSEFYALYDRDRNVRSVDYDDSLPIHLSFDFNINPHMSLSLWQIRREEDIYKVGCFEEIAMESPRNSTEETCVEFMDKYPDYALGVFIYGDASGRVRSTTSKRHNYDIIEQTLKRYMRNWSMRVPKRNPLFNKRRDFVNRCLAGGYKDREVFFDPRCEHIIADMDNVLSDASGGKLKRYFKNKAGVPVEKYGHFSDTMDYLLCSAFENDFKNFGKKL